MMAVEHLIWSHCTSIDGTELALGSVPSSMQNKFNGEGECQGLAKAPQLQRITGGRKSAPTGRQISMVMYFWFETFGFPKTVENVCG